MYATTPTFVVPWTRVMDLCLPSVKGRNGGSEEHRTDGQKIGLDERDDGPMLDLGLGFLLWVYICR